MISAEITHHERHLTPPDHLFSQEGNAFPRPETVLLAEDNDDLRYVMECSLKAMGYRVIACANGQMALAEFHADPAIDLLLTDFEMPARNGLELARELTNHSPSVPVIIFTGGSLSASDMQEIQQRHWAFVSKPCHMSTLEATLCRLLKIERAAAA